MIKVEKLSVRTAERTILSDINFTLEEGQVYSIIGKNGEGKSVLLKCCTLLLDKYHFIVDGNIYFQETNLFTVPQNKLIEIRKNYIRYVFQDAINTFDPLKKIKYYFQDYNIEGEFGVNSIFNKLLLGNPSSLLNTYPYEISTGQAQRICFALAILAKPKIIILDEPTSALDQINGNIYLNILADNLISKSLTVLIVTHDLKFAIKASDKIAILKEGTLSDFTVPDKFDFKSEHSFLTT